MPAPHERFRFLRLEVWQRGRLFYRRVAGLVRKFPREERFELASQMRRSARSVCANFAEGAGRRSDKDFAQFVEVAYGSLMEVASDAYLAMDSGYLTESEVNGILDDAEAIAAKASGLYRRLTGSDLSGAQRSALRAPRPTSA